MNTQPLTLQGLKGKVEPLEFWTFDCVNCIRTSPHMSQLHRTYAGDMFVLIGVHTPESEFEKDPENVAGVVSRLRIENPITIDGEKATWKLYGNQYCPRQILVDSEGPVSWERAREEDYDRMEEEIRALMERGGTVAARP